MESILGKTVLDMDRVHLYSVFKGLSFTSREFE